MHLDSHRARIRLLVAVVPALAPAGCSLLVDTGGLTSTGVDAAVVLSDAAGDAAAAADSQPLPSFGPMTSLATGQTGVFAIETDDAAVYWITRGADDVGTVATMTRAGAGPLVLASTQAFPRAFTSDATRLYWATGTGIGAATYIASVAKTGGAAPDQFLASAWGHADVSALAVRGTQLVWASVNAEAGSVHRASTNGSSNEVLASAQGSISAVAFDPPAVYWASASAVLTTGPAPAPDAGAPLMLAPGSATSMIVAGGTLYWASQDGTLHARAPGAASVVLAQGLSSPAGLAADDRYVYCACSGNGTVVAIPRASGASVTVARAVEPVAVAVTRDAVYFADRGAGAIGRVAKQ